MIDEKATSVVYGYTSDRLSHASKKKVICYCDNCGLERHLSFGAYKPLCHTCKLKSPEYLENKRLTNERKKEETLVRRSQPLTQDLVKSLFMYKDGVLYWRNNHRMMKKGDRVGFTRNDKYDQVKIFSKPYLVHRIIFLYHHGYLPDQLDHIDRDRSNNQIDNLREVTGSQNRMNSGPRKGNNGSEKSSKYTGVSWRKDTHRWISYINGTKTRIYIGAFIDEKDAAIAYNEKAKELHGEYACLNEVD